MKFALTFSSYLLGLMLHNVLQGLQKFAESRHYLVLGEHVDMGEVKEFFKPVFSTEQRLKEKEEMVVYNFHQFLKKIESKLLTEIV